MTIKKFNRNQRFEDYEDRPSKPKHKDRSEKHFRNALRTQDLDALKRLSNDDMEDDLYDDYEYDRR
jgi:hypothetical protein